MEFSISDQEIKEIVHEVVEQTMSAQPTLSNSSSSPNQHSLPTEPTLKNANNTIAIGADHGGVDLKEILKEELVKKGYRVIDCGTNTKESVDYPDIALAVASRVASGEAWRGVCIDGAGIGSCMAANKVPGIRAALCYDYATAVNSREHNDANVLTLGAGLIGINLSKLILNTWLTTEFGGGRHARRVNKITAIGQRYYKDGKLS